MIYRKLDKTGRSISAIALVHELFIGKLTEEELKQAIHWCDASEEEYNFSIDTFTWKGHRMYSGHRALCTVGINISACQPRYPLDVPIMQ